MDPGVLFGLHGASDTFLVLVTKRPTLLVLALYVVVAAVLLAGTFGRFENLGGKDWNAFLGQAQAETTTLLDDGQLPAWNPWRRGGQVSFAQPESMFLSPVTPLALLFGANAAFKLLLVPLFVAAAMGMWALAGELGLIGVARALPGAVFIAASVFPLYVNGGLPNWLCGMAILPWLLLSSRRAATSRGWLVGGAALYAGLLFCGNVHHFVFFPLLLALEAAVRSLSTRSLRPLLATAALGVVGVALSLVRLVPLLELFSEFPRQLDASNRFMPLSLVARSLLLPHPPDLDGTTHGVVLTQGSSIYWVDCGAYVGPLVALLAVAGVALAWRRAWPHLLIGGCFLWLALGSSVRFSLWDALRHLPVYASMQAPERFMGLLVFSIALLAGFGGERVVAWLAPLGQRGENVRLFGRVLLLLAVVVPLLWVNATITRHAFPVEPPRDAASSTLFHRAPSRPPFTQRRFPPEPRQWGGPLYEAVLRNAGNVDGQSDVPSKQAAHANDDVLYRGELFLHDGHGTVGSGEITPNRIRIRAHLDDADTLVVNQTFFPGWRRADSGEPCVARDGLIALPLVAGDHELELEYAPRTIPAGALLTLLALIAVAIWARARRRTTTPRAAARVDAFGFASHALLVGGVVGWFVTREPSPAGAPPTPWRELAITVAASGDDGALQRAIDAAPVGAIVRLLEGTHGPAVVRRGVTLVGDPPETTSIESLTVEDLPAEERVAVEGLSIDPPSVEQDVGAIAVRRCRGAVILAWEVSSGVHVGTPRWCELAVEQSGQVFLFGDPVDPMFVRATLRDSRVSIARCGFWPVDDKATAIEADASVVLLNSCLFVTEGQQIAARRGSLVRTSQSTIDRSDIDTSSSLVALDERFPRLVVSHERGREPFVSLAGPPRARGTLVVAHHPAFVPYRGAIEGQFLLGALDRTVSLLSFELDERGALALPLPPPDAGYRPGDGLYLQAFFAPTDDPKDRLFSLMDGGPIAPAAE